MSILGIWQNLTNSILGITHHVHIHSVELFLVQYISCGEIWEHMSVVSHTQNIVETSSGICTSLNFSRWWGTFRNALNIWIGSTTASRKWDWFLCVAFPVTIWNTLSTVEWISWFSKQPNPKKISQPTLYSCFWGGGFKQPQNQLTDLHQLI